MTHEALGGSPQVAPQDYVNRLDLAASVLLPAVHQLVRAQENLFNHPLVHYLFELDTESSKPSSATLAVIAFLQVMHGEVRWRDDLTEILE